MVLGYVSTFAGGGGSTTAGFYDGVGTGAMFNKPFDLVRSGSFEFLVVDANNHAIRSINAVSGERVHELIKYVARVGFEGSSSSVVLCVI